MGVSENNGTPKSSILIGFSIIKHPFWGTSTFGNTHRSGTSPGVFKMEAFQMSAPKLGHSMEYGRFFTYIHHENQGSFHLPFQSWKSCSVSILETSKWAHLPCKYSPGGLLEGNFIDSNHGNFQGRTPLGVPAIFCNIKQRDILLQKNHCTCGVPFRINFKTMAPLGCVIVACQRCTQKKQTA